MYNLCTILTDLKDLSQKEVFAYCYIQISKKRWSVKDIGKALSIQYLQFLL